MAQFGNNAPSSDTCGLRELHKFSQLPSLTPKFGCRTSLAALLLIAIAGCRSGDTAAAPTPAAAPPPQRCGDSGRLQAELYGAIAGRISWDHSAVECSGMPRPEGRGARLRFAGPLDSGDRRVALIIAIPDLERGLTGDELESNVTLIEEGSGRFFSTSTLKNCLTNITDVAATDDSGDRYSISGTLYCVAPLAEVNGTSSVSVGELHFSGLLDWSAS